MKPSELQGRFPDQLFEKADKVIIVGKAAEVRNLRNVEIGLGLQY